MLKSGTFRYRTSWSRTGIWLICPYVKYKWRHDENGTYGCLWWRTSGCPKSGNSFSTGVCRWIIQWPFPEWILRRHQYASLCWRFSDGGNPFWRNHQSLCWKIWRCKKTDSDSTRNCRMASLHAWSGWWRRKIWISSGPNEWRNSGTVKRDCNRKTGDIYRPVKTDSF